MCNNFLLPYIWHAFNILVSAIQYFLYGIVWLFDSFLISIGLWGWSYVGGCVTLCSKIVDMFVSYWISETYGKCREPVTPIGANILCDIRF